MNYRILLYLLNFVVCSNLSAQDFGSAVVIKNADVTGTYGENFVQALAKSVKKYGDADTQFYTWNEGRNAPKLYPALKNEDLIEKPITAVAYVEGNLKDFGKVGLTSKVDSTGKVTGHYLNLYHSILPKYKVIHLPTGEVLESNVATRTEIKKVGGQIVIKDYSKYSKIKPESLYKSNKKKYNEVLAKIKEANQREINERYEKKIDQAVSLLRGATSVLLSRTDDRLWSIADAAQAQEKKLKEFWIDATKDENLKKGEFINVYAKQKYGDVSFNEKLTVVGVTVEEVTDSKVLVSTNMFNRKNIKEAVNNSADIILARSPSLVRASNVDVKEYKRVQVKSDCFTCAIRLESMIGQIPNVKLIERQFDPVRNYFVKQYTNEKFIDFPMGEVQSLAEGADYLFQLDDKGLQATNVASGRIERVDQKKSKGFLAGLMFGNLNPADVINLSLDILELDIELLEITSAKKGKAKKVRLYSPVGFHSTFKVAVVREVDEKVGGRTIARQEEIGELSGRSDKTSSVKDFKVKSGGKDIFEAKESGKKLKFIIQ